jgi:hypothetical protein
MRSIRPALRFARTTRYGYNSRIAARPSIFSPQVSVRRFYSGDTSKSKEKEQGEQEEKSQESKDDRKHHKEDTSPPPDPNKSPFQVFVDTFKSELSKSQELQESMKALQDESGRLGDSEALRRAKEAYELAKVSTP